MPLDILQHQGRFPQTVYILAPGILGRTAWEKIPRDGFVIAVNKGILIPDVQKNIWMAEDVGLHKLYPWFDEITKTLIAANHPLLSPHPTPVFGDKYFLPLYPSIPYFYRVGPSLRKVNHRVGLESRVLYGHGTISCKAVQMAAIKGAKRIILCGVDMQGYHYFDGQHTESGHISPRDASKRWFCVADFTMAIKHFRQQGIRVESLSPTALPVAITQG